jgi:hypothetical protein
VWACGGGAGQERERADLFEDHVNSLDRQVRRRLRPRLYLATRNGTGVCKRRVVAGPVRWRCTALQLGRGQTGAAGMQARLPWADRDSEMG